GQYAVELVVTDNNTEKIIYSRTDYITITDQLVFEYNDVPDSIGIAYTENPNALNWTFFKTTDSINITGTIKDKNNNTVQGASVNATLTGSGTDMSNTTNETGAYEIGFSWNSIAVGTKTLTITANDTNNNTATYIQTIYISNYANKTTVSLDRSIYEYNTENVTLTVNVLGASDEKVYLAEVTVSGDYSATKKTDENGVATFIFPAPKEYTLSFSINAKSPLNTSLTLQNSTSAYSVWLYYENITITPENPKVGQTITIAGEVYVKGNKTGCGSGSVNIKVYKGAFSKNITDSTLNSNEFSKEFEYGTATSGKVPFEPGTWYYALDGSISSCIVRERTFTSLTADDPSTKSDDFTITSNSTTTTSSGDDDDDSTTTDTTSSTNEETCTQNSDCSSGDYCLNSVCTAISCDDGVIVDHQCISAYKIDISENPEPFFVEQGTSKSFEFTVKNTGYKNLTNITGSLIAPETLLLENWYSMTELKSNLAVDEQNKSTVQITVPETESIKAHTIKIKIVSAEKTQEKNMTLQVTPGEKEQRLINSSLNMLTTDIADTEKDIETLMKKLGNSNTTTAKTKLDTVKKLHTEALEAISTGDYLTAYHKKQEINSLMQDIRAIVTDGQASIAKSSSLIKTVFLALFSIAAIGALFYYLWVPAPNEYANSGNYGRISKKSTNPFIAKIKAQVDNVVNEYKKQKETEANAPQKYNFHKKKRWSK
ncbi:MAG: hypothetical protein KAT91_01145, partial [Candidatus Aenigmarchaeota archaeon]|nr:hypothetical protein [Candidatus Aenigmarchaeota archaeon]